MSSTRRIALILALLVGLPVPLYGSHVDPNSVELSGPGGLGAPQFPETLHIS